MFKWSAGIRYCIFIGCPNKSATFNFVINTPFIQKVPIFLFQYKVHILRLIVEHNIRQMSPTTQQSRGGRQCAHFKSCALVGTPHIFDKLYNNAVGIFKYWTSLKMATDSG